MNCKCNNCKCNEKKMNIVNTLAGEFDFTKIAIEQEEEEHECKYEADNYGFYSCIFCRRVPKNNKFLINYVGFTKPGTESPML